MRRSPLILFLLLSSSLGCSNALGPEVYDSSTVSGRVTVDGRPVPAGWVEFSPAGGGRGSFRSAPLGTDGTYHLDRVAVGLNHLALVIPVAGSSNQGRINVRQFRADLSQIRRQVKPGVLNRFDLDLASEASLVSPRMSR